MPASVETLDGLKRKITVSIPTNKIEEEVSLRLKNLARKVKLDGFRPGKAPFHIVKHRYTNSVLEDVAKEMVQPTLIEALKENDLQPAGYPAVDPQQLELGKDFIYSAEFEIMPKITITELSENDIIDLVKSEVDSKDVDAMIEKLREQNKDWEEVSRPVENNDKVVFDFEGYVNGEKFEGGAAENYELVIGSNSMIPGFETSLIKGEKEKPFDIQVTFPEDYGHAELAGKDATFKITIHKILQGKLPELNDAFAEAFNIKEGGLEALKKDIKENMSRELEKRLSQMNREKTFDKLLAANPFDLPEVMVNQEIEHLKHEMYHRLFGHEHHDNEKIPDFPRELFEEQAKRRVHLGLLFSEYVKKHQIIADKEQVDAMIEKLASAYEDPDALRSWYRGNKERLGDIEALVMEDLVAKKISEHAKVTEKMESYDSVMNPPQDKKSNGE